MIDAERPKFADLIDEILTIYDVELRPGRAELYWRDLKAFSFAVVAEAAAELRRTSPRFPALSAWIEACKLAAARRARVAAPTHIADARAAPATWHATANIVVLRAAIRGLRVADPALRARALEIALAELVVLREDHNTPNDVAPSRLRAEQDRIADVLVHEFAGESVTERAP